MQTLDILCVGDALMDIFLFLTDPNEHSHKSMQGNDVCFNVGAKIPVDNATFSLGGNASNVAVGLSRLGLSSAIVAETGDDMFAEKIKKGLAEEKVLLDFFKQTLNTPATFSVNIVFSQDRTIFSRHFMRQHAIAFETARPKWVYLTSVGDEWKMLYEKVNSYVSQHNVKLAFNPGSKQLQAGRDSFLTTLNHTEVLFVNKEEAEKIVYGEEKEGSTIESLLKGLQNLGAKIVSITDGADGSYAIDEQGQIYTQSIIPGTFMQKTGVGDAYASGFLASLFYNNYAMQTAMVWGAINAASVIAHMGAQGGLLTKEQLGQKINV